MIRKKRLQLVQTTNQLVNRVFRRVFRQFAARRTSLTDTKRKPVEQVPAPSSSFRLFLGGKR